MQSQKFTSILQKTYISRSLKAQVSSPLDQPIDPSLSVQSTSNHGNVCGKLGLLINARFLFGLSFIIAAGQLITYKEGDSRTQTTAPSATKKMRQPNTYSLLVCLPGNSGSAFWIPWTCQVWYLLDILTPLRSGGESPGGKCQSSIRKVSTPLLYWEHGSSGNTESPVCLMDLLQIFGLPYRASKMNPTYGKWEVRGPCCPGPWVLV